MTQDLYYVESGYLTPDSGYYVYTADAEAAVSSAATMAVTAGVIKDCVSTIVCQTTVAAVISHIHGADLVAFSNAAIATQITVIRGNNVALTSVFSAAIDGSRGIYVSAQADSTASISIANFRVRYSQAAHSAAFSLAADVSVVSGVVLKEAEANLSSAFTQTSITGKRQRFEIAQVVLSSQSTQAERTRDTTAIIVSQAIVIATVGIVKEVVSSQSNLFTSTVSASRTREFDSAVLSAFTPTLIVDAFKNSFAVLDTIASLSVQAETIKVATATTSSQFTTVVTAGIPRSATANFSSQFSLYADKDFGSLRPVEFVNNNVGSVIFTQAGETVNGRANTGQAKYGTHSIMFQTSESNLNRTISSATNYKNYWNIPASTPFAIEFWVYITADKLALADPALVWAGRSTADEVSIMSSADAWNIGYGDGTANQSQALHFTFFNVNTFSRQYLKQSGFPDNLDFDVWKHIAVNRDSNGVIRLWEDGGEIANVTYSGRIGVNDLSTKLHLGNTGFHSRPSGNANQFGVFIDEFSFRVGSSTISGLSSAIKGIPGSQRVLQHFDNNLVDDTSVVESGTAILASIVSQTVVAQKTVRAVASIASTATMTTLAVKNAEIILTAFGNAAVTTNGNRLRFADSNQSSAFTQSVEYLRVRFADSAQSSSFAQNASVVKTVSPAITTDAIFSELAAVAKTGAGFVQVDCVATMAATAVKTTRITEVFTSQFTQTTVAVKSVNTIVTISSQAALAATILRIRNQVLVYAVNSQLEAVVGEIEQFSIELTAVSSLLAETGGILQAFADFSSQASLTATILRIKDASSSLASEFTQTANTVNSKTLSASATLAAEATVTADVGTIKQSAITTDAIFSELVAVAKTGQGFITLDSQATLSAVITKTSGASAGIASQGTVVAVIGKLQTANSAISSSATFTASGTFVTTASANFSVAYTLVCNVVKTASAISLEASAGTLTALARADKRATAQLSVLAFELALGSRTQTAQATLTSTSTMVARIGGTFGFRSTLQGFAAEVAVIDVIHIDAKLTWMIFADDRDYSIQSENRTYSIVEEDRDYLIVRENREYAVTRELLTTELQGV